MIPCPDDRRRVYRQRPAAGRRMDARAHAFEWDNGSLPGGDVCAIPRLLHVGVRRGHRRTITGELTEFRMRHLMRSPRSRAGTVIAAAILALFAAPSTFAQQQFQFFLSAADSTGARVRDLAVDELVVSEGDRPVRVVKLDPITWPVKVTVMVDNGIGTSGLLVQYRNGLKGFFDALPAGVEASLLTLAPQPRWVVRPTSDRVQLTKGVDRISPDPGSARLLDALIEVADRIENENADRTSYFPVIVILSTT